MSDRSARATLGILAVFTTAFGAWASSASAAASAPAAQAPRHVLVIYDEDKDIFPGLAALDRGIRQSFEAELGRPVVIHSESLGLSRSRRAGYESELVALYRSKYAESPPDLIVAVLEPVLDFMTRHADTMFPGVPVVFCGVDSATIKAKSLPANFTGVLLERTYSRTLEVALRLQPQTRNVFVVVGNSRFDRYLEAFARRDLKPFEERVAMDYLVGLTMEEWLKRVSSLPANSIILYVTVFSDASGRRFVPHDALSQIAAKANAPVYVFLDQFVGLGAVGGNVYSTETQGIHVASLGRQILDGAPALSLPILAPSGQVDLFDARQIERWHLDPARLPPGSVLRFEEPTAWALYHQYIIATLAVLLVQAALIGGLLLARRRQRRAEAEARRQRDDLAHVLRVTTLGELTSSLAHEVSQPLGAILLNAEAALRFLESGATVDKDVEEALGDILRSAEHASLVIDRLRALFRKESVEHVMLDAKELVADVVRLLNAAKLTENIDVRLVLGDDVPPVWGDAVQLKQVLLNLARNACDAVNAAADGPRVITIRTRQNRPGYAVVEVSDTGVGVKDGEIERIFEPFVSTKPLGLGMGLAISRSIIESHGGRIWATANADRGLTVHIELASPARIRHAEPAVDMA